MGNAQPRAQCNEKNLKVDERKEWLGKLTTNRSNPAHTWSQMCLMQILQSSNVATRLDKYAEMWKINKKLMQFFQTTELLKDILNLFFCLGIILEHEWHNFLQKLKKAQNVKPCEVQLGWGGSIMSYHEN
jgi:hypothetical protein